ncbi:MAG: hypothetical protein AVDCRST_MAG73-2054, partial [uncultured Thermomicrobiales bacterium]
CRGWSRFGSRPKSRPRRGSRPVRPSKCLCRPRSC